MKKLNKNCATRQRKGTILSLANITVLIEADNPSFLHSLNQ
jgi:hypothetical protein